MLWFVIHIWHRLKNYKIKFSNKKKHPSLLISININYKKVIKMAQYFFYPYKKSSKGKRERNINSAKPVLNTGN